MDNFEYALPSNVEEVFKYLESGKSMIKAGGVDIIDLMKEELIAPARLINIKTLDELKYIKEDAARGLLIGPAVLLADLAADKRIQTSYRALAQAAGGVATPQLRNMATLGGNLCQRPRCWYFRNKSFPCSRKGGDTCYALDGENQYHAIFGNADGCAIVHPSGTGVALMALDAQIQIRDGKENRMVQIENFFVAPAQNITRENILAEGELITGITVPVYMKKYSSFYFKQKEKQAFDWPLADVAVALHMSGKTCKDARIILGSAAPVPLRVKTAEDVLKSAKISALSAQKAAETAVQGAEPLELNTYKIQIFRTIIYRTICRAAGIDPFVS